MGQLPADNLYQQVVDQPPLARQLLYTVFSSFREYSFVIQPEGIFRGDPVRHLYQITFCHIMERYHGFSLYVRLGLKDGGNKNQDRQN